MSTVRWILAIVLLSVPVWAEETYEFDPLIVTPRGYELRLSEVPGGVGLLDGGVYDEGTLPSIPDALKWVPGVDREGESSWGSEVNVRGLSRSSVIFLIDGARVETANDLNARFGLLNPAAIERVEILKGPISALYGSGSIGGVVNVITRGADFTETPTLHTHISLKAASNPKGEEGYAGGSWSDENQYVYGSIGYRSYDEYEDGDGVTMRNSQFEDVQGILRMGVKVYENQRLDAQIQLYEGRDIGLPGMGEAPLPTAADVTYPRERRNLFQLVHTLKPMSDTWTSSQLSIFAQTIDRRVLIDKFPAALPLERVEPGADHTTLGVKWVNEFESGDHAFTLGLDSWGRSYEGWRKRVLRNGAVLNDEPLPDSTFQSTGVFGEDQWQALDRLSLTYGGRVDWIHVESEDGDNWDAQEEDEMSWSLQAGAVYKLADAWQLDAVVARAYRAATLEERFAYLDLGNGVVKWGDPALDPEESVFGELGVSWAGEELFVHAGGFYNLLDNLIAEDVVSSTRIVNANIDKAKLYGGELEVRWLPVSSVEAYGNMAYTEGEDRNSGEPLPNVAPLNGVLGLKLGDEDGPWAALDWVMTDAQDRVPDGVEKSSSWQTVDLRAGYRMGPHHVFAGINNVFDEVYQNYLVTSRGFEFNEPGRNVYVGYEGEF